MRQGGWDHVCVWGGYPSGHLSARPLSLCRKNTFLSLNHSISLGSPTLAGVEVGIELSTRQVTTHLWLRNQFSGSELSWLCKTWN